MKKGLEFLSNSNKEGIKALIEVSGIKTKTMNTMHVGFILGPRINASGRLSDANLSLKLLLTDSKEVAFDIANALNTENKNRQRIETEILDEVLSKVEREFDFKKDRVIVVHGESWHPGVIGIVASRLVDRFYRPAIVLSLMGGLLKGSARSIEGFHIFDGFNRCKEYLVEFGGHRLAAGLSLKEENLKEFSSKWASKYTLTKLVYNVNN